jgi:protein-S-isoprenylcysteine O-methyltransferase Ste14
LFFSIMTTMYILVAIQFEEADLVTVHGEKYQRYRQAVPMIVPSLGVSVTAGKPEASEKVAAASR